MSSYEQYYLQARTGRNLFILKIEKMNDLFTVMELSDRNFDNGTLCRYLKLIDPSNSYVNANQLREFRMWAKKEIICHHDSGKRTFLAKEY